MLDNCLKEIGCLENLRDDPRSRIVSPRVDPWGAVSKLSGFRCKCSALLLEVCLRWVAALTQLITSSSVCKYEALCIFQISGYSTSFLDSGIILGMDESSPSLITGTDPMDGLPP